jgi:hypothetical protein
MWTCVFRIRRGPCGRYGVINPQSSSAWRPFENAQRGRVLPHSLPRKRRVNSETSAFFELGSQEIVLMSLPQPLCGMRFGIQGNSTNKREKEWRKP